MHLKTAVTVGTEDSVPEALVLFHGVERSIPVVHELGYDGIEIALYRGESLDVHRLTGLLRSHQLSVPVISTGQMSRVLSLHLVDPDPQARSHAIDSFSRIIDVAAQLKADINVSLVRGVIPPGMERPEAIRLLGDALTTLCKTAHSHGLNLLLEQMNRYETNLLNSVSEVGEFIRMLQVPNLKIHADTYHMNIEDADMCAALREYAPELGYIHFSDSNRLAPGQGHIDFASIARTLNEIGYDGWVGVETLRIPDGREAARQSIDAIRQLETAARL